MSNTLTISSAHEKLRSKKISAVELVQSCIDRIESVDKDINAVVYKNFDAALQQAKKCDEEGVFDHPLTGIPYLTKDVFCEEGVATTACSNMLRDKDYTPPFHSTTTKRLTDLGAISLGKANTDEFTMGASTETSCYGVTKNPWNLECVAGGSSGGPAAAVAADECLFALGTDTGGSIRQPASFCNCTGLRTTYGRTSRYGVMSMASSLDTIGPLAKNTEDLAIILEAIAGKDPKDGTSGNTPVPKYTDALTGNLKGMTIGLPKEYFIEGIEKDVEEGIRASVKVLEELGATIKEISLPHTQYAASTYYILCPSEVSSNMARYDGIRFGHTTEGINNLNDYYTAVRSEGFGAEVKRRILIGTYALSAGYFDAYYRKAQKVRTLITKDFEDAFASVDAIISPVGPNVSFKIGAHEGDPLAMYLEDVFTIPQVMAGIPALSVPCGFDSNNMPIGLQIMGPQWGEEVVLKVGEAYEKATQWNEKKPNL